MIRFALRRFCTQTNTLNSSHALQLLSIQSELKDIRRSADEYDPISTEKKLFSVFTILKESSSSFSSLPSPNDMAVPSLALSCLQNSLAHDAGVEEVLKEAVIQLTQAPLSYQFTASDVEHCFQGIRYLDYSVEGIPELLVELRKRIASSRAYYSSTILSTAYNGLQTVHSTEVEVRSLLRELLKRFKTAKEPLSVEDFSLLFMGLQHMSTRQDEVRDLVVEMTKKVKESRVKSLQEAEGAGMMGFSHLNRRDPAVKALLMELKRKDCDIDADEFDDDSMT